MSDVDELARRWASERNLASTPAVLEWARRRICAWGRLAQTPLVHLPAVRVRVLEHGPDLVAPGCVLAEVWVDAADPDQLQRLARDIHRVTAEQLWPSGLMLVAAVHHATRRDHRLARREWRRFKRATS